ncbi:hypothetical protein M0811_11831 [Anaeramoeba ignava]|uniref:Uncharacterized protein n=1 Tax=Anaeramoeba ignava TaxID=1746090 RepID=A0A9Q0LAM6_ANAIG|nr:hypothetical protein M0811_11831 [Anaeramoeba ignava]
MDALVFEFRSQYKYAFFSQTDPKLSESIIVKLKELYNLDVSKTKDGGFTIMNLTNSIRFPTLQVQIIQTCKEHGFKLTHFSSQSDEVCYSIYEREQKEN